MDELARTLLRAAEQAADWLEGQSVQHNKGRTAVAEELRDAIDAVRVAVDAGDVLRTLPRPRRVVGIAHSSGPPVGGMLWVACDDGAVFMARPPRYPAVVGEWEEVAAEPVPGTRLDRESRSPS